jgi:hypothetical protein
VIQLQKQARNKARVIYKEVMALATTDSGRKGVCWLGRPALLPTSSEYGTWLQNLKATSNDLEKKILIEACNKKLKSKKYQERWKEKCKPAQSTIGSA